MAGTMKQVRSNYAQWINTPEHEAIRQAREHKKPTVEVYEISRENFYSVAEAEETAKLCIGRLMRLGFKGPGGLPWDESEFCKYRDLMMDASYFIKNNSK